MKRIMTKKHTLMRLYLFLAMFVFSQENNILIYSDNPISTIVFENNNNRITVSTIDPTSGTIIKKSGVYSVLIKQKVPFINVVWNDKTTDIFLMLINKVVCFLYKAENQNPYVFGFSGGYNRGEGVFHIPKDIKASSSLMENGKLYSPNQINSRLEQVWAEGEKGQGIGEKLFINPPYLTAQLGCTSIHISIGFVSFEKPYLYEENSRPKKLNISVANKFSFTVDLQDTPDFQTIKFPQTLGENDILVIEILDIYPGTKYEDTCINSILYDTEVSTY
jgi:hypothetical protein